MRKIQVMFSMMMLLMTVLTVSKVEAKEIEATPTMTDILLNDELYTAGVYNIEGNNYFQLRDVAQILSEGSSKFDIGWDQKNKMIQIIPKKQYSFDYATYDYAKDDSYNITYNETKLLKDDKIFSMKAYIIDNATYYQLRELSAILGIEVGYDAKENKVTVKTEPIAGVHYIGKVNFDGTNLKSGEHPRWAEPVTSFIYENSNNTITTVDVNDEITITTYDPNYKVQATKELKLELPIFGTFYSGEQFNYISYGQENKEETNKEVIRVVKYDKNFNRIAAASITGDAITTTIPFNSATGRMAEQGDVLAYHTSRTRYTGDDGLNHQSQLTFEINTQTMQVMNELKPFPWNHVSHSFDQYVLFDGNSPVYLDHGDAYPRSLVLNRGNSKDNSKSIFEISGATGANVTGVSIGGFEQSNDHLLVAFNSINQNNNYGYTSFDLVGGDVNKRNIYVYAVEKGFTKEQGDIIKTEIANYEKSNLYTTTPTLVKVNNDKFVVLWQEYSENSNAEDFKFVYLNGKGEMTSAVQTLPDFELSKVQPIVINNKLIWFTTKGNKKTVYEMKMD
ncbi:MAG: hypothetical protein RR642_03040 [Solibacillus sp.]